MDKTQILLPQRTNRVFPRQILLAFSAVWSFFFLLSSETIVLSLKRAFMPPLPSVLFFVWLVFFPSPNSFKIVFGENPFGCSSCPCISSHSQTCSLPSDIGKNKWPTYRNTWYTPYTLQQHKLGKKPQSLHRKSTPQGQAQGTSEQTSWVLRQESLWQLVWLRWLVISAVNLLAAAVLPHAGR